MKQPYELPKDVHDNRIGKKVQVRVLDNKGPNFEDIGIITRILRFKDGEEYFSVKGQWDQGSILRKYIEFLDKE